MRGTVQRASALRVVGQRDLQHRVPAVVGNRERGGGAESGQKFFIVNSPAPQDKKTVQGLANASSHAKNRHREVGQAWPCAVHSPLSPP